VFFTQAPRGKEEAPHLSGDRIRAFSIRARWIRSVDKFSVCRTEKLSDPDARPSAAPVPLSCCLNLCMIKDVHINNRESHSKRDRIPDRDARFSVGPEGRRTFEGAVVAWRSPWRVLGDSVRGC
jgi:hypothetical protein